MEHQETRAYLGGGLPGGVNPLKVLGILKNNCFVQVFIFGFEK